MHEHSNPFDPPFVVSEAYLFLGISLLCEGPYKDSLDMICSVHGLNIPEDVAGATFMAAASSESFCEVRRAAS